MMTKCTSCKCNICGNMHNCEAILDRIIESDQLNKECEPVSKCSEFKGTKDYTKYKDWTCEIRNFMKGGDAINVARTDRLWKDKDPECNNG